MEGGLKPKKNEDTQKVQVTHEIIENLYEW